MRILAVHPGHDASIALYDDYRRLFISKEERLIRLKNFDSQGQIPKLSWEKLRKEHNLQTVEALVMTRTFLQGCYYRYEPLKKKLQRAWREFRKQTPQGYDLAGRMRKYRFSEEKLLNLNLIKHDLGIPQKTPVYFSNHHYAHALPALFYKPKWSNALIYTADGGGDADHYGIFHFDGANLEIIYGGDAHIYDQNHREGGHSLGQMYCVITEIAGFTRNRHEGKITGLAGFGKPVLLNEFKKHYYIRDDGVIRSRFKNYQEMEKFFWGISKTCSMEDLASSGQKLLEDMFVESMRILQQRKQFQNLGLCGGVFSNVRLNQVMSELSGIEDVFIFPPMGDEGLVIGAVLDVCIRQYGFASFLKNRHELGTVYWGDTFKKIESCLNNSVQIVASRNIIDRSAELLRDGKVCALFTGGMEYGPRALGNRSILINPADRSINDTVNHRLARTEFMPFAPVVREERATDVFETTPSNTFAMKYMTITCGVKSEWRDKIPGVVHVDNTARPQIIARADNPLYYDILFKFEELTGLPCLVNTSFNAHEEPIINTPQEALNALMQDRIDYLITDRLILKKASLDIRAF
ncbi:MAG: carbamoyltransferase C-terminal domain-containing protein [Verrucomicrobiota bacterium]